MERHSHLVRNYGTKVSSSRTSIQIRNALIEVAPTTLRLMLFICRFQFLFVGTGFSSFTLSLSADKGIVFLLWSWTLIQDSDLRSWSRHGLDKPPCQTNRRILDESHFVRRFVIVRTQTHAQQIECCTWTTKWPVERLNRLCYNCRQSTKWEDEDAGQTDG